MSFTSFSTRFAGSAFPAVFLALLSIPSAAIGQAAPATAVPNDEQSLDTASVISLTAGQHFQISIPLRPSRAINLGIARLDVTLSESRKSKQAEPELHLLAIQTEAQTTMQAGGGRLILHGVAPQFGPERAGEYHPSDYSVHLGSGNVTNIGAPDDTLIDTDSLTKKLQGLRVRLAAAPRSEGVPAYPRRGAVASMCAAIL